MCAVVFFWKQPGIILLKEGTDSSQGVPQLISNINACQFIADAVRTTLGPRGMDKLIVNSAGSCWFCTVYVQWSTLTVFVYLLNQWRKCLCSVVKRWTRTCWTIYEATSWLHSTVGNDSAPSSQMSWVWIPLNAHEIFQVHIWDNRCDYPVGVRIISLVHDLIKLPLPFLEIWKLPQLFEIGRLSTHALVSLIEWVTICIHFLT